MITGLDHVALAVSDLDAAVDGYRRLLGREPNWIGRADGVRQAWFQLPNMALDLIAPEGEGAFAEQIRAHIATHGEGLWAIAFAVADLEAAQKLVARRGLKTSTPAAIRTTNAEGAHRNWTISSLDVAETAGLRILLVGPDEQPWRVSPPIGDAGAAVSELDHLVIHTPNCDRTLALYGAKLGLDLRLDRSNPDSGVRQLFFRCGGTVVEFGASLKTPPSEAPDRSGGLAWRSTDNVAAQARIAAAGFDVSEVRKGRKPGTTIFTVRSGVVTAPTVVMQQNVELQDA